MTQIGDIICDENGIIYAETADWCNNNNAMLEEIEPEGDIRRFKVVPVPESTEEEKAALIREKRNNLLHQTDKYMLADFPISPEKLNEYKSYRQQLRDITKQTHFPDFVEFPTIS